MPLDKRLISYLDYLLPFASFVRYGLVPLPTGILIEKYNEKILWLRHLLFPIWVLFRSLLRKSS